MDAHQKLMAARIYAIQKMPYFRTAIFSMVPREMPGLGTFGVTKNSVMMYDPQCIKDWSVQELGGVILHEVNHILRKHYQRCKTIAAHPQLWNKSADAESNDDLRQAGIPLPQFKSERKGEPPMSPVYPEFFGMPEGLLAEAYYSKARQEAEEYGKKHSCNCGSGAGNPLPGEPDEKDEPGRSEMEIEQVRKQTARAIQDHASKQAGSVPGNLLRWAEQEIAPPKVSWKDKVARAARSGIATQAGCQDFRYAKPSRRQMGVGLGHGKPIFPILRAPKPKTVIVADTSGSVGDEMLKIALSEINGIIRAVGSEVIFMASDATVHTNQAVRSWQAAAKLMVGGGGTDFTPAFEAAAHMPERPTLMIYITDGCGAVSVMPHQNCSVIWLLIGKHKQHPIFATPSPFGSMIEVDD